MNEGLERLRSIGAQRIHEETHIARKHVQAILHESFEGMQRVQLLGFISIMEREYGVELEGLRQKAQEYFDIEEQEHPQEEPSYKKELLVSTKPISKTTILTAVAAGVLAVVVLILLFGNSQDEQKGAQSLNATVAQQAPTQPTADENSSQSTPEAKEVSEPEFQEQKVMQPKKAVQKSFRIIPKSKVWVGYIDLSNGKKTQKIISDPLELNASKDYLLTFGHGYIDIDVNGKLKEFKEPQSVKFIYQSGELRQIDAQEFKRYNKGKLW